MSLIQRARRRKITSQKLKEQGYMDSLFIKKSKADALLKAHKEGVDISKLGRKTKLKEIEEKTRLKKKFTRKVEVKDFFEFVVDGNSKISESSKKNLKKQTL